MLSKDYEPTLARNPYTHIFFMTHVDIKVYSFLYHALAFDVPTFYNSKSIVCS